MSSMQDQARGALDATQQVAARAIEQIPPDAWPIIDLMMRVVVGIAIIWLVLALIGWWRSSAYNLTDAATVSRNKKAQPGFLDVDHEAREAAIKRGEAHEEKLDEREREDALATLRAAAAPISLAGRIAKAATFIMSVITLLTGFSGAVFNVTNMSNSLEQASASGRIEWVITTYPIGSAVVAFVIGYNIWRYVADKKWEKG